MYLKLHTLFYRGKEEGTRVWGGICSRKEHLYSAIEYSGYSCHVQTLVWYSSDCAPRSLYARCS
jgi:hypothetical protein